jgi:hypothetical protein
VSASIEWNGDQLATAARQAALEACERSAEVLLGKSQDVCPLKEGTLRGSGAVNMIENGAEISYNTPYALVMHEKQDYTPSTPETGPNYLRQPLLDHQEQFNQDITEAIKAVFGF